MKILLDHCVPRKLARGLPGHEVSTAREMGWDEERNGRLMRLAADGGFVVLLTMDANLTHQQPSGPLPVAVLVLRAVSNDLDDIAALLPEALKALETISPGTWVQVGAPPSTPKHRRSPPPPP